MKQTLRLFNTFTPVYYWNSKATERHVVNQGGTSSSKTMSIIQVLIMKAVTSKVVITIAALTHNSFERGALKDFKELLGSSSNLQKLIVDPSLVEGPYIFKNGSKLEFIHLKDVSSAKHGKRDYLFINEANHIPYDAADAMIMRTFIQIFYDFNADAKFWVHDEILVKKNSVLFISNYTHNPYIAKEVLTTLLGYKDDFTKHPKDNFKKNRWHVYGLGKTGVAEGVIFDTINYVKFLPINMSKVGYGLDFGFKNDPTALCRCGYYNGEIYAKELIYETNLLSQDLVERFKSLGISKKDIIIADSANQEGIAYLQLKGYNVISVVKPKVLTSLNAIREYQINITMDSYNWSEEQTNYKYAKKNGRFTNTPNDEHNHLWDALRYWFVTVFKSSLKPRSKKPRGRRVRVIN